MIGEIDYLCRNYVVSSFVLVWNISNANIWKNIIIEYNIFLIEEKKDRKNN